MLRLLCTRLLSLLVILAGCSDSLSGSPREVWVEGGPGAPGSIAGHNFYRSDVDRYPGYAIFTHSIAAEEYSDAVERASLVAGIRRCRAEFSLAYRTNTLKAYDSFDTHRNQWISGGKLIPFNPEWVVIIIRNMKHVGAEDDPVRPYLTVGYVLPAAIFFDPSVSPAQLLLQGFRDEHPIHLDAYATFPGYRDVYSIIERHRGRNTLAVERYLNEQGNKLKP